MVYTILRCLLSSAQLHIGEQSALLNTLIGSLYYLANAAERRTQRTRQEIAPGGRTVDNKWRKTTKQHLTMWRREEWGWGNYTWEARDGGASELRPFTGRLSPGAARCVEPSPLCTGACEGEALQAPWGSCSWRSVPQRVSDNFENIDIKLNLVSKTEPDPSSNQITHE